MKRASTLLCAVVFGLEHSFAATFETSEAAVQIQSVP